MGEFQTCRRDKVGQLKPLNLIAFAYLLTTAAMAQERLPTIPLDQYTAAQKKAAEDFLVWSLRCQALHDVALLLFREMSCIPVQRPAPITPTRQVVLALNWLSLIVTIGGELARGRGFSRRNLVYGRSTWDRNHDAAMRIGSEAPRGGPNLLIGMEAMEGQRDTATSDRHRPSIEGLSRATEPFS